MSNLAAERLTELLELHIKLIEDECIWLRNFVRLLKDTNRSEEARRG